ncbi:DHA2 family efflux MFS transporter permease subunit [Metallumcola ferriviriculae]|uniref:DHA2 family efflux MFS transporter permease subunit n=1 Tax=Metallumcola ferriviriculae TaxID=3039180 RepID=A0AAU0UQV5_9FIRM|nr:DHA2 family efflux MFS transporter permease subunit [Desulfitibacteraceae bacterium MK1]
MTAQARTLTNNVEQHWVISMLVIIVGAFMAILDSSIINIAIPTLMHVFEVSTEEVQWVVTIYMLTLGVVVPTSGWLGDKWGYKKLYILSLVTFTIGSILCGLAWNLNVMIAARVIQALGGGMIMPTTMSIIFRIVPKNRLGTAMGFWGMALLVAPALGPTLGGYLVEYLNWRLIFYINVPIGILGFFLCLIVLPEFDSPDPQPFDFIGFLTSSVGLFTLLLAFSKGEAWGWTAQPTVLLFYTSIISLGIFVYNELTIEHPMLELRIFKYGMFTASKVVGMVTMVSMYVGIFYLPLFLQNIRGLGAMETGLLLMPGALVTGLMMPISGRIYDKIGALPLTVAGIIVLSYTTFLLSNLAVGTASTTIIKWVVLRGIGMGLVMMPAQTAGMAVIPQRYVGQASAISNVIQRVSSSFGLTLLTTYLTGRVAFHRTVYSAEINPWSEAVQQLMAKFGSAGEAVGATKQLLMGSLQGIIAQKAFVRGIDELFIMTALFCLIGLIPSLFLKRVK